MYFCKIIINIKYIIVWGNMHLKILRFGKNLDNWY